MNIFKLRKQQRNNSTCLYDLRMCTCKSLVPVFFSFSCRCFQATWFLQKNILSHQSYRNCWKYVTWAFSWGKIFHLAVALLLDRQTAILRFHHPDTIFNHQNDYFEKEKSSHNRILRMRWFSLSPPGMKRRPKEWQMRLHKSKWLLDFQFSSSLNSAKCCNI